MNFRIFLLAALCFVSVSYAQTSKAAIVPDNQYQFITPMYVNFLHRYPEDGGMYYWALQTFQPGACTTVGRGIAESWESMNLDGQVGRVPGFAENPWGLIFEAYRGLLNREPESWDAVSYWYGIELSQGRNAMLEGIINSQEFKNRCQQLGIAQ